MNIMIVTNSKYLDPAYVMLDSLFLNNRDVPMDIYLPYEDLTEQELSELGSFCGQFPGKKLYPLYVGTAFKEQVQSRNGINVETYYRILGLKMLPEDMERILYLDVDMVICGSLQQMYDTDLTGNAFGVCEDIFGKINGFHEANKKRLGIPEEYSYFNAGVMLFNLEYIRETNGIERMLQNIYTDYERYEYNDQDVMNEMYFDKLVWLGWDEYNCPPAWYYLDKPKLAGGMLEFAGYDQIREASADPEGFAENYQNMTKQIYENAKIVHYLADTKPWSGTRKQAAVYDIFDPVYYRYEEDVKQRRNHVH